MIGNEDDILFASNSPLPDPRHIRRWLHANPEIAFEEVRTANLIANNLRRLGYEVHESVGKTGVVGLLKRGEGPTIALRADMDALPILETSGVPHASRQAGRMHACGHDGHIAILLSAAREITTTAFAGTVALIFQPAEEIGAGAKAMLEHPLFHDLAPGMVAGLHNWPELKLGQVGVRRGPLMASADRFEVTLSGKASHAALPHQGSDIVGAVGVLIPMLQEAFLRRREPRGAALISLTDVVAKGNGHSTPEHAVLRGTIRCLDPAARTAAIEWLRYSSQEVASRCDGSAEVTIDPRVPATVNARRPTEIALEVARGVVGTVGIIDDVDPTMGGDDFGVFSERWPGVYLLLGTGVGRTNALHSSDFDFNDDAIDIGSRILVGTVSRFLSGG